MVKKKGKWALVGVLLMSTIFVGCSTPSDSSQKTDQRKVEEGKVDQVTSLDVTKMKVDQYFPNHEGTFILRDLGTNQTFVYNQERAKARQSPNSTFKVANALIGLQVGAVKDEYEVKRWDGVKRDLPIWNKDHTLASGMRFSVIWYYQAMARDIGKERMQEWLDKINYGNKDISGGIDKFWLNSSLKISPLEEVDFISNLVQEKLPFDKKIMKTVKRMMIQDEEDNYTLYAKTGTSDNPPIGWFVGFVKTKDHTYVFATNVDGQGSTSSQKAKQITVNILKEYKIIDTK